MKISFSSFAFAAVAISFLSNASAQGVFKFANTATSLVMTNDGQGHIGAAASTSFHVAIYWGALGSTEAQLVQIGPGGPGTYAGVGGLNPALPGRFSVATPYVTGSGTAPGGTGVFEVKGWTGNYASYDEAYAAALSDASVEVGISGLFTLTTGGNDAIHYPLPPTNLGPNFTGLTMAPLVAPELTAAPEPSTYALLGLGLAIFGWKRFRRS